MSNNIGIMMDSATGDSHFVLLIVRYPHPPIQQNHAVCGNMINLIITEDWLNTILNRMTSYATNSVTLSTFLH
jgi:hypothetical protein